MTRDNLPGTLLIGGAALVVISLGWDVLLGRSPVEGTLGVLGLLLAGAGGWLIRRDSFVTGNRNQLRTGEGIVVLAGTGAVLESVRQLLNYEMSVQLGYLGTVVLIAIWAIAMATWFLVRRARWS